LVPDYPSPAFGHTPLVPSVQFDTSMATPPLLGQRQQQSATARTPGHETTDMHTPPLHGTGSDRCACDHSTPVPGHTPRAAQQMTFTPEGFATDDGSRVTSLIRRQLENTSARGNNETSRWDADNVDASK